MAKYTITIKTLIKNNFDFGLTTYPIFNETYRKTLNENILNYYYENEIGFETEELFKFYLNNKMKLIMPKYNILYKAQEEAIEDIFTNVNITENSNRINNSNTTSNSNSNSTSSGKNLFQDTPQGQLDFTDIELQSWATNLTLNKINDKTTDSGNTIGNGEENFTKNIKGNNGNKYNVELLEQIKNNILNIDILIINELNDLFMGLL